MQTTEKAPPSGQLRRFFWVLTPMEILPMIPYELDERRLADAEQAAEALYLDGATDAAFNQPPERADEDYLAGYMATLKNLPRNEDGTIQRTRPQDHFAWGYVDTPDPSPYDAEF
jgi:hypothetical protein